MALPLLKLINPMEDNFESISILTIKDAVELMQLSERTVRRLISSERFPACKIGHQWRIRSSDLAKWIQAFDEL